MGQVGSRWGVWCEQKGAQSQPSQWLSDYAGIDAANRPAEFRSEVAAEECAARSRLRNPSWAYEPRLMLVPAAPNRRRRQGLPLGRCGATSAAGQQRHCERRIRLMQRVSAKDIPIDASSPSLIPVLDGTARLSETVGLASVVWDRLRPQITTQGDPA